MFGGVGWDAANLAFLVLLPTVRVGCVVLFVFADEIYGLLAGMDLP